ncbi:hypothetical protein L2Y96_19335 [Luteibacter aegosomaticola]|uniref:hypothetical protein n=1 Tax=Luteibacter aegosomaticola TaxID=2911538 RepID=UPI001FF7D185|nr:hypothetical protein [Luteibacter aegosomaticola]UPG89527.1 hypothetical protein L2Y96_19335 [Luteibacter aegosomaticola]
MRSWLYLATITASLMLAGCAQGERPVPLPGQEKDVADMLRGCAFGVERILPGDYYFCQAGSHYWAARFGMARDSLESAAHWASKPAQHALGIMYFNGDHAVQNRPLGVAWLALAAERHEPDYEGAFVAAYQLLTPEEHAQADAYWNTMKLEYADAYAAPRAQKRFDRELHQLETASLFGGDMYLSGVAPMRGITLIQRLKNERTNFFAGYESQVWVGDATLVPLSEVKPPKPAKPVEKAE